MKKDSQNTQHSQKTNTEGLEESVLIYMMSIVSSADFFVCLNSDFFLGGFCTKAQNTANVKENACMQRRKHLHQLENIKKKKRNTTKEILLNCIELNENQLQNNRSFQGTSDEHVWTH